MIKLRKENILNGDGFHIGETIIRNEMNTFQHTHDFYEIFIIKEGDVYHCVNGRQILMKKDAVCLVFPEDIHSFKRGKCKKVQFVNLAFSEELFEMAKKSYGVYGSDFSEKSSMTAYLPNSLCVSVLAKISFLAGGKLNLYPMPGKDILVSILVDCIISLQNQPDSNILVPGWLELACLEMRKEENYMQGLSRFVELSGKSQEHLTRCMKKFYSLTPTEYMNRIKLGQAIVLLETTDKTILDIMLECGFNNGAYFNQLFKEEYGVTPGHYRAVNRSVVNPV